MTGRVTTQSAPSLWEWEVAPRQIFSSSPQEGYVRTSLFISLCSCALQAGWRTSHEYKCYPNANCAWWDNCIIIIHTFQEKYTEVLRGEILWCLKFTLKCITKISPQLSHEYKHDYCTILCTSLYTWKIFISKFFIAKKNKSRGQNSPI